MRINRPDTCYVCKKGATTKQRIVRISPTQWRHVKCRPGSYRWLQSEIGLNSEYRFLFKTPIDVDEDDEE